MLKRIRAIEYQIQMIWCKLKNTAVGGLQSIMAGDNITIDNTDPLNPVVSATGGGLEQARQNGNVVDGNVLGSAEFNKQGDRKAFAQLGDVYDNQLTEGKNITIEDKVVDVKIKPLEVPTSSILADLSNENFIMDMRVNSEGVCFATTFDTNKVLKITKNGVVSTFVNIYEPLNLLIDSQDNLFITSYSDNQIQKITPTGIVSTHALAYTQNERHWTIDSNDNIIITGGRKITKITPSGEVIIIASNLSPNISYAAATPDNIYYYDDDYQTVNKIDILGEISIVYSGTMGYTEALKIGPSGDLYILQRNYLIKISQNGSIEEFPTYISAPRDIVIDSKGYAYITTNENDIKIVTPSGVVSQFATTDIDPNQLRFVNGNLYTLNTIPKTISKISTAPKGILKINDIGEIETLSIIDAQGDATFTKQLVVRPDQTFGWEDRINNSYSTDEIKTGGTWIDGKPIYRIVIETDYELRHGETIYNHLVFFNVIPNLKEVIKANIYLGYKGNEFSNIESFGNFNAIMSTYSYNVSNKEYFFSGDTANFFTQGTYPIRNILEYTKTTD